MTTSGAVILKAGANVSSVLIDPDINQFINEAESYVNIQTRFNWTDAYGSLNDDVKQILNETVSNLAAIYVINYDPDAIGRSTAVSKINVLWDRVQKNIQFLKNTEKTDFVKDA